MLFISVQHRHIAVRGFKLPQKSSNSFLALDVLSWYGLVRSWLWAYRKTYLCDPLPCYWEHSTIVTHRSIRIQIHISRFHLFCIIPLFITFRKPQ